MKKCDICPNNCLVENSICGRKSVVDENIIETTGIAIDPVEKKPLYHYKPGSETLSVGGLGCNLKCLNCQNHDIAQPEHPSNVPLRRISPESLVDIALDNNINSISWTYNEPTIHPDWIISTAKIAKKEDIDTILVTNGYTSEKTLEKLVTYVDAVNVDLKSMDNQFYVNVCKGLLSAVENSIEYYYMNDVHTEVTTLLIPGYNDSVKSIENVCEYISSISTNIVLHFSAFYPRFKLNNLDPTSEEIIFNACEIAKNYGLKNVYPGNVSLSSRDNTYCEHCNELLVERNYYNVNNHITKDNRCPNCNKLVKNILLKK
jgi:pyruvate formate lyase activating enzyme